jgi:hypothetical protein
MRRVVFGLNIVAAAMLILWCCVQVFDISRMVVGRPNPVIGADGASFRYATPTRYVLLGLAEFAVALYGILVPLRLRHELMRLAIRAAGIGLIVFANLAIGYFA